MNGERSLNRAPAPDHGLGAQRLVRAAREHWPEFVIEALGLGLFMLSACAFTVWIEHPGSTLRQALDEPWLRRTLIGLAMGATAIALIYSPWGKRSGAHLNPSVTLTFARLGKIEPADALFYIAAQFAGGVAGVIAALGLFGMNVIADPAVCYVVTQPGSSGVAVAFAAEMAITFGLMLSVLAMSNAHALNRYTGLVAGALVALYITIEAPLSGMSMNPARSFASAVTADMWNTLWLYFVAPPLGALAAAQLYLKLKGKSAVLCCKLHHENEQRCIFRCRYGAHTTSTPAC
jgi:aquaporin Z